MARRKWPVLDEPNDAVEGTVPSYDETNDLWYAGAGVIILSGTGSPEGAVTAPVGALYIRTDGGAGTTLYVKESGTGDTGWDGK